MAGKYKVIVNKLELELKRMRSEGKTKLPSEQALCEEYSCSRQTVRAALDVLLQRGLIVKKTGAGSFIADDIFSSKTIYFMTEDCDRYQSPALVSGLKDQLEAGKYELKAFSTGGSVEGAREILLRALDEKPAALIIEPSHDMIPDPNMRIVEAVSDMGIPVIYCNSLLGSVHVVPDNIEGGRMLTDHLLKNGRQKIACVFRSDDSTGRDRYQGYINALLDSDSAYDESRCLLLSHQDEKQIIAGKDNKLAPFIDNSLFLCDAVICQNGMIAHRLVKMLLARGVSIPRDIIVACFDNGCYSDVSLLSMEYDNDAFCKALAGTAVALAEGRSAKNVLFPLRMI